MADIDFIDQSSVNASTKINQLDLKNRKKFPRFSTRIIEDFFPEPYLWRHIALQQEYYPATVTTYPGKRSTPLAEIDKGLFDSFGERLLELLPMYKGFFYLNASFFMVDETFVNGWVHDDDPDTTITGIIYLNDDAPLNSGTTLYDDRIAEEYGEYHKLIQQDCLNSTPEERQQATKQRNKQRSFFTPSVNIDNVFNRCVLFDPKTWHSADNFFGNTKETSRLTLVFYAHAGG
tara:strand:+ start:393 stop:1091 length:699 start_codon:yes stop_codon:yes gene_type:complete